ncbi:MAG: hypothetical protein JST63_16505 [Bacteroidetes bacterium]|nr:hypothetical protein [Bacteroidota bacterium]
MGLIEKRAIKSFREGAYNKLRKEINSIAGLPVEFEVNWESLSVPDYSQLYEEGFTKVYFTPVINAFKEITSDSPGKDALKNALKKIVIKNEGAIYYGENAYSFDNGVLTINHEPCTNIDDIKERTDVLSKILSSNI